MRQSVAIRSVIVDGDAVDLNKHSPFQLMCLNQATIIDSAAKIIKPLFDMAKERKVIRGTEAHSGGSGQIEELLARQLEAHGPSKSNYSWWHVVHSVSGVEFDVTHHPSTNSTRPWTMGGGAMRQSMILMDDYRNRKLPSVAVRAHVHHFEDSGLNFPIRTFFLRPWVTKNAYDYRCGRSSRPPECGGLVFICRDGKYVIEDIHYKKGFSG